MDRRRKYVLPVALGIALVFLASVLAGGIVTRLGGTGSSPDVMSAEGEVVETAAVPGRDAATPADGEFDVDVSEEAPSTAAPASSDPAKRLTVRNATIAVRVDDLDEALATLRVETARADGYIQDLAMGDRATPDPPGERTDGEGPRDATVTIRVPAERAPGLVEAASKLGSVTSQAESELDVTYEAVDLDARLRNLEAEEERLRSFLDETDKVSEMLEVERELARVRGEIEAITAQLTYLERQAAMATVTVSLLQPGPVVRPAGVDWGLRDAVTQGVQTAAAVTSTAVTGFIAMSPLVILGLVVYALWRLVRRRRSQGAAGGPQLEA